MDSRSASFLERVIRTVPHEIIQAGNSNLAEIMGGLAEELKSARPMNRPGRRRYLC